MSIHDANNDRSVVAKTFRSLGATAEHIVFMATAVSLAALPICGHLANQAIGVSICVVLSLSISILLRNALPALILFVFIAQNLVVSIASPFIFDLSEFKAIRGYNFIIAVIFWASAILYYVTKQGKTSFLVDPVLRLSTIGIMIVGLYFVFGAVQDPFSAVIYLRNIVTPILMFQMCYVIAIYSRTDLLELMKPVAYFVVGYGYFEVFLREELYYLINAESYIAFNIQEFTNSGVWVKLMYETGQVIRSYEDTRIVHFLNSPLFQELNLRMYRIQGPNFHSISYGYSLLLVGILSVSWKKYALFASTMPLLLIAGSKGALLALVVSVLFVFLHRRGYYNIFKIFIASVAVYTVIAIVVGYAMGDYHVLGFFGGIRSFLGHPLGAGLGVGGNLSGDASAIDWPKAQALGYTDHPVESAVGVLLYQVGILAFVLLWIPIALGTTTWTMSARQPSIGPQLCALAVITITANGIFQEEALFAPLALGAMMVCLGVHLGRARRDLAERESGRSLSRTLDTGEAVAASTA